MATPEAETATPAESADADLGEFGDIKKKKKSSKKKAAFDLEAFEKEVRMTICSDLPADVLCAKSGFTSPYQIGDAEANDDVEGDDAVAEGDLGDDIFASGTDAAPATSKIGEEAWVGTTRDYSYPELLSRFYALLHSHNPELAGDKKKLTLVPPQVTREGTKKTMFANLAEICRRMHRQPKHLMEFLFAELGTSGSVDAQQRLIIKGRYTQKSMENVLRRYIGKYRFARVDGFHFVDEENTVSVEYVVCKTCKSPDTLLNKENRLYFITCESCGSRKFPSCRLSPVVAVLNRFIILKQDVRSLLSRLVSRLKSAEESLWLLRNLESIDRRRRNEDIRSLYSATTGSWSSIVLRACGGWNKSLLCLPG